MRRVPAEQAARFAALYRAACADLALSDAYHLPAGTVAYLHQLVGRAHNQFYRTRTFDFRRWSEEVFVRMPRLLFHDPYLRVALLIFWGVFLLAAAEAYFDRGFAEFVAGKEFLTQLEEDFSEPLESSKHVNSDERSSMAGFYIQHNGSIGLRASPWACCWGWAGCSRPSSTPPPWGPSSATWPPCRSGRTFFTSSPPTGRWS